MGNNRSLKLQEEYIVINGLNGIRLPKSRVMKNRRYYLHNKARSIATVNPRAKTIEVPGGVTNKHIDTLIKEYGYVLQLKINTVEEDIDNRDLKYIVGKIKQVEDEISYYEFQLKLATEETAKKIFNKRIKNLENQSIILESIKNKLCQH
jgi:hypothetical protein